MLSTETREEIEARALEITAYLTARDGKYFAEIVPDCQPQWHLLTTFNGKEDGTAGWLADRRIGVAAPRFQKGAIMRLPIPPAKRSKSDRKCFDEFDLSEKLIFPGRLFVFVWDVLEHWRRIKACPGVRSIVCDDRERPIVITQAQMNKIQALQFSLTPQPKPKRDRHKGNRQSDSPDDILTITSKSYWVVDPEARNGLLNKALSININ